MRGMRIAFERTDLATRGHYQHVCCDALLAKQLEAFEDGTTRHSLGR